MITQPTVSQQTTTKMSYEAYLDWVDEDTHAELDPFVLFCEMRGLTPDQIQQIQQLLRGQ